MVHYLRLVSLGISSKVCWAITHAASLGDKSCIILVLKLSVDIIFAEASSILPSMQYRTHVSIAPLSHLKYHYFSLLQKKIYLYRYPYI